MTVELKQAGRHDTKEALLDAAESLFAEHGLGSTSLRAITQAAGANLAAVNYHFGSKEALVEAVIDRGVRPLNEARLELLQHCEAAGEATLEGILRAFVAPPFELYAGGHEAFPRILGRLHFEADERLHGLVIEAFKPVSTRFIDALGRCLPQLPVEDLYWRLLFSVGAMSMAVTNSASLAAVSDGRCDPEDQEAILDRLVAFVTAGFRQEIERAAADEIAER